MSRIAKAFERLLEALCFGIIVAFAYILVQTIVLRVQGDTWTPMDLLR